MNNNIILKCQPNFRDLGGVITTSGLTVTQKKIFRSGFFGTIDSSDLSIIKDLKIEKIIDLRTPQEINIIGKGDYPESIGYNNIALSAGNITKSLIPIFQKGEFHLLEPNLLEKIYLEVITKNKPELAAIYREITYANQGIVYHCSHGKDRTGIISALLLDFFEVDRNYIYTDYVRSNEYLSSQHEHQLQKLKDNFTTQFKREVYDEEFAPVKSLFYCHEDILKTVFDFIDSEYNSTKTYFEMALGLSEKELSLLKSKYLE